MLVTPDELPRMRYYKLTNETECHNGLQFHEGLNVDPQPFRPDKRCGGGMYFFPEFALWQWIYFVSCSEGPTRWIREVTFPEDARIWDQGFMLKCDKFILGPRQRFSDQDIPRFVNWTNPAVVKAVKTRNDVGRVLAWAQSNGYTDVSEHTFVDEDGSNGGADVSEHTSDDEDGCCTTSLSTMTVCAAKLKNMVGAGRNTL